MQPVFIQLTDHQTGAPTFIRPEAIMSVWTNKEGHHRIGVGSGGTIGVRETPKQVIAKVGALPMVFNSKDKALLLAGMRTMQRQLDEGLPSGIDDIVNCAWTRSEYIDIAEHIDELCERVNCG